MAGAIGGALVQAGCCAHRPGARGARPTRAAGRQLPGRIRRPPTRHRLETDDAVNHTRCESTRARGAGRVVSSPSRVRSDPRAPPLFIFRAGDGWCDRRRARSSRVLCASTGRARGETDPRRWPPATGSKSADRRRATALRLPCRRLSLSDFGSQFIPWRAGAARSQLQGAQQPARNNIAKKKR